MKRRNTAMLIGLVVAICVALFLWMDPGVEPEVAPAADGASAAAKKGPSPIRSAPVVPPAAEDDEELWPEGEPPEEPAVADDPGPVRSGSVWPLTKDGIDGSIREVMKDIRMCYQDALAEVSDLEGGFKVHFVVEEVDGLGEVTEVEIRDMKSTTFPELVDGPMEDCVLDLFETLQFDVPEAGRTEISYPFLFSSE